MRYRGAGSKQGVYGWATTTTDADHSGSKPVLLLLGDSRTRNDVQRYIHRVTSGSNQPVTYQVLVLLVIVVNMTACTLTCHDVKR